MAFLKSAWNSLSSPGATGSSTRFSRLGRHYDLMLVALIVAVIALLVLPLPPYVLDTLIAFNLTVSVTLLIVSLYIASPLGLSTFPSLLLFTTLFRLSLNIASTRQILLHAYAGDIISTFGKLVVGGDVIIGMVVFAIIAIVQFIVIAKGSERVAEVAARFSLDAMPGKQMSIDADLRAGIIHKDDARQRRRTLESESQLYGAMDGAMKFVKGDAIAGIIIALVNIFAGIMVGMLRKDMSLDTALQTYSVLAVGDALVSQIPSLFVSIAAGIVITRVARSDSIEAIPLGNEIAQQIKAHPKALVVTGIVVFGMLLVPGFPKWQFLALGLTVALTGWNLGAGRRGKARNPSEVLMPSMSREGSDRVPVFIDDADHLMTIPIVMEVYPQIAQDVNPLKLDSGLENVRRHVAHDLGIPFPGMVIRSAARLSAGQFVLYINEIPMLQGYLMPGHVLCLEEESNLTAAAIPYVTAEGMFGGSGLWVPFNQQGSLTENKFRVLYAEQILAQYVLRVISRHAHEFMGIQETQLLLKRLEDSYPDLEKELKQQVPLSRFADVLRRLVQEQIPIRDLRLIAHALIETAAREKDNVMLTEYVRNAMVRSISYRNTLRNGRLAAIVVAPGFEDQIKQYLKQSGSGSVLLLPETLRLSIHSQILQITSARQADDFHKPVLLVNAIEIRAHLRSILVVDFPDLTVLASPQVEGSIRVDIQGQIQ
ncbi:type III secretion protein V [Collimonas sp. PA-H2]|uniref:type III secretion system export apparatus subunit SctV n=1 Tax=Collimonas sp. PA-H2 TaxID=1881062 RepID=UPI000BFA5AEE|nr:type III secretion system export apparatus subunit SctV [Collimonas sp. PA-H2]PFH08642.1 type III secretion protein V [Collimonas sp. PA-H2]